MMTNGPAAQIGEVMNIPFPVPLDTFMEDPEYYNLRNQALDFCTTGFAHEEK